MGSFPCTPGLERARRTRASGKLGFQDLRHRAASADASRHGGEHRYPRDGKPSAEPAAAAASCRASGAEVLDSLPGDVGDQVEVLV